MIKSVHNTELMQYEVYENGDMIGRVEYFDDVEPMVLSMIYVEDKYRGQGKAGIIADETYKWLKEQGKQVNVTCHVLERIYSKDEYKDILASE